MCTLYLNQRQQEESDEEKYDMIANLIIGINNRHELFTSYYVKGDPRDLKMILRDLIEQKKIYLNPKDGNFYRYDLAIQEKMLSFKCQYCSAVLYSADERDKHAIHYHMSQRRAY